MPEEPKAKAAAPKAAPQTAQPAKPAKPAKTAPEERVAASAYDDYELLPHQEIVELRDELQRLKETPTELGKHFQSSVDELNKKMDKMIRIFERAEEEMSFEEGGAAFKERMRPYMDKMNKVLEQNSEIAEGIVALADLMNEVNDRLAGRKHMTPSMALKPGEQTPPGGAFFGKPRAGPAPRPPMPYGAPPPREAPPPPPSMMPPGPPLPPGMAPPRPKKPLF